MTIPAGLPGGRLGPLAPITLATVILVLMLGATIHPAAATALNTSQNLSNVFSDVSGGADSNSSNLFNWGALVSTLVYFVIPAVSIVAVGSLILRIKEHPDPGQTILSALGIAFILGLTLFLATIPSRMQAAAGTAALLNTAPLRR